MASRQKTFDKVARHLVQQGRPCLERGHPTCRNDKGHTCPVGRLVPQEVRAGLRVQVAADM